MPNSANSLRSRLVGSLQGQLQMASILSLFAGFTAASCASLWIEQRNLTIERGKALHERAEVIHSCMHKLTPSSGHDSSHATAGALHLPLAACLQGSPDASAVFALRLSDGTVITPTPSSRFVGDGTIQSLLRTLPKPKGSSNDITLVEDGTYYLLHPHRPGNSSSQLIAIENLTERSRHFTNNLVAFFLIWGLLLVATAAVVSLAVKRAIAPLRYLSSMANSINADNLPSTRLQLINAPTEVVELGAAYDQLLERLSDSWSTQKQFVSAVSHELRNPLTLVSGYIRRTLRRGDNLSEDQKKGLSIAEEETNRIIRLIGQLLDLSRSDCGTFTVQLEAVRLAGELEEVVNLARSSLNRPLRLELPLSAADRAACVRANADRIRQVLMNLIENADKYSPTGTPIDVRLIGHNDTMEITVTDQGIGIPEADQEHIFERFYRASNTKSVEGSGMGLAVAKILVESMGGTISVSSQIGSGTVFQLSFPLITTPSPQETVAIPAASRA